MALSDSFLSTSVEQGSAGMLPVVRAAFRRVWSCSIRKGVEPSPCAMLCDAFGRVSGGKILALHGSTTGWSQPSIYHFARSSSVLSLSIAETEGLRETQLAWRS